MPWKSWRNRKVLPCRAKSNVRSLFIVPFIKCTLFTVDLDQHANEYWNKFYECHEHRFFKDRNWFAIEFPELFQRPTYLQDQDSFRILEVGCGAGNTVFPVLRHHQHDPRTWMYACDFSSVAVDIVKVSLSSTYLSIY